MIKIREKNMRLLILVTVISVAMPLVALSNENGDDKKTSIKIEGRWYTNLQLADGKTVFKNNCAVCHGDKGQSVVEDWENELSDGTYPAPPLNGTAHTWHHSKKSLLRTINTGGIPLGGRMPPFKDKLTEKEKAAVVAYFMSLWPDRIYKAWEKRNAN